MKLLLDDETLFKNIEVFNPDYVPEQFLYRNDQLQSLSRCIKPSLKGARPVNALLVGPPATGKTTSIKTTFEHLSDFTNRVIPVYVNCSIIQSSFRIFSEIHKKVFGFLPPETGSPLTKIYDSIFEKISREKKVLLVALDDMTMHSDVLYSILRAHEMYNVKTGVFAVLPRNEVHKLDEKTRSIFSPQEIRFPVYKSEEIFSILKDRASAGLYESVAPKAVLETIAAETSEDLRFGIELLKNAVLEAESKASRLIKEEHVETALSKMNSSKKNMDINEDAKLLLELIKSNENINSGRLFEIFGKKSNASYSTFYRLLNKLESLGLIKTIDIKKGGKTRLISTSSQTL